MEEIEERLSVFPRTGRWEFPINRRAGTQLHKLVELMPSDALHPQDAAGNRDALAMRVTADSAQFLANGKEVTAFSRVEMHGVVPEGQPGLRVNHNLDVHVVGVAVMANGT